MIILNPKIVFLGTPDFAVPFLNALIVSDFKPVLVITQPDKRIGREQKLTFPPVKLPALAEHLKVAQPKDKSELLSVIKEVQPDLCVLVAYGIIINQEILEIPKFGFINVHPSLLPKHRGSSPVQSAILNADEFSGVTIIKLDNQVDHGPIIAQDKLLILPTDTNASLHDRLAVFGADLLIKILPDYISGKIKPKAQDDNKATLTKQIQRQNGLINWSDSAPQIERKFRAFCPWPGIFSHWDSKRLKIADLSVLEGISEPALDPGTVFLNQNKDLAVVCGQGAIKLERLQLEGKKEMSAQDFLRGSSQFVGAQLQ